MGFIYEVSRRTIYKNRGVCVVVRVVCCVGKKKAKAPENRARGGKAGVWGIISLMRV